MKVFSSIVIGLILMYRMVLQPITKLLLLTFLGHYSACKHSPTCSEYTINQIKNHGTITGLKLGLAQFSRCR